MVAAEMCELRPPAQASTLMGVGEDLVRDAKRLLRHGDEDLLRAVREGVQTVSAAVQEKDRKNKAQFTFLDRALQGHNERDAQVVYAAKPLLQYLGLRIHDYLDPRTAEPMLNAENGSVIWDPAELKVPDWLYTERGDELATERRARLTALLPRAKESARAFPGKRCPDCGLPLLSTLTATDSSYCAVCKGNVLWEWSWMREQVEIAFSSALGSTSPRLAATERA